MAMLAASAAPGFAAVKSLGLNTGNAARGLESIGALVTLFDAETGQPVAVMEGGWVTALRTAALSTVAARRLARADARSLALIGCGVQANSHLDAFVATFPIEEVWIFGRGQPNQWALRERAAEKGLKAHVAATPQEAVHAADLIVTSVPDAPDFSPFLDPHWLLPGAFVAMTDLARSWYQEGLTVFDRVVIDDREQEAQMAKPMLGPAVRPDDLGDLVAGRVVGRESPQERTAFAFRGLAFGDLALAALAYEYASAQGIGRQLER